MKKPFFSIIVPIYNTELYLNRCIDSIIQQTFKDIEIILVNDGSKDKSLQTCLDYMEKDNRIRIIHKKNEGLAETRNEGLKKAIGDYIIFVDSDDYIDNTACETFYDFLHDDYQVDMIAAKHEIIKKKRKILKPLVLVDDILTGIELLKIQLSAKTYFCNVIRNVYNRRFLIDNQLYFKKGFLAEDVEWSPRVYLKARRVKTLDFAFYKNVQRKDSITNSKDKTKFIEDVMFILNDFILFLQEIDDDDFKILFKNYIVNCFLNTYMMKKYYKKDGFNDLFDKKFLKDLPSTRHNKNRVILFSLSRKLYYFLAIVAPGRRIHF